MKQESGIKNRARSKAGKGDCAQCQKVPDRTNHEHHGIQLNLCYNQFTGIKKTNYASSKFSPSLNIC